MTRISAKLTSQTTGDPFPLREGGDHLILLALKAGWKWTRPVLWNVVLTITSSGFYARFVLTKNSKKNKIYTFQILFNISADMVFVEILLVHQTLKYAFCVIYVANYAWVWVWLDLSNNKWDTLIKSHLFWSISGLLRLLSSYFVHWIIENVVNLFVQFGQQCKEENDGECQHLL